VALPDARHFVGRGRGGGKRRRGSPVCRPCESRGEGGRGVLGGCGGLWSRRKEGEGGKRGKVLGHLIRPAGKKNRLSGGA